MANNIQEKTPNVLLHIFLVKLAIILILIKKKVCSTKINIGGIKVTLLNNFSGNLKLTSTKCRQMSVR